ncbi:hypothetical protein K492DRAFT_37588 [Lichtheimia hyalospora FSU 10163]|nr:hypothetical protein K492DRAFT_37588 [Lichtheimia hyalospora FSU 10163]
MLANILEATVKTTTSTWPLDGFFYYKESDLVTSRYSIGCNCQVPHQRSRKQPPGARVFYWWIITATRGVIGVIMFFVVDIDLQS